MKLDDQGRGADDGHQPDTSRNGRSSLKSDLEPRPLAWCPACRHLPKWEVLIEVASARSSGRAASIADTSRNGRSSLKYQLRQGGGGLVSGDRHLPKWEVLIEVSRRVGDAVEDLLRRHLPKWEVLIEVDAAKAALAAIQRRHLPKWEVLIEVRAVTRGTLNWPPRHLPKWEVLIEVRDDGSCRFHLPAPTPPEMGGPH